MKATSLQFTASSSGALLDENLKSALGRVKTGFIGKRLDAVALVPEWEAIRAEGKAVKDHVLEHLDHYLLAYEARVTERGGQVHWAAESEDLAGIVVDICRASGARTVTKGKSMVGEEADLNGALAAAGMEPIETDLGEYIIQLAGEGPSHIIAPAIHKTKEQVSDLFHEHHAKYGLTERLVDRAALVAEARAVLREKFRAADVGITGANFLIAETGQHVLVTNEGNGDLTSNLPRVQIVVVGIEKLVPTLEDASALLRLLARSATGQHFSNYTSLMGGPRAEGDLDGPEEFHVVLVDNHRTDMLEGALREMLRCIRCGACMNHCPVYGSVGGHSYGWVYPGPMGSVITPATIGIENAKDLPHACTLNGRCAEVCPMSIPLPKLLREHRRTTFERELQSPAARRGMAAWAAFAKRPALYRRATRLAMGALHRLGGARGRFSRLPLAGAWTKGRDLPAPQGRSTFMALYAAGERGGPSGPRGGRSPGHGDPSERRAGRRVDRRGGVVKRDPVAELAVGDARPSGAATRRARRRPVATRCSAASVARSGARPPSRTPPTRPRAVRVRLGGSAVHTRPFVGEDLVGRTVRLMEEVLMDVVRLQARDGVPEAVRQWLDDHGQGGAVTLSPALADIAFPDDFGRAVRRGAADGLEATSVTPCLAAIAETGSVVFASGGRDARDAELPAGEPRGGAARGSRSAAHVDDVFPMIRALAGTRGAMPRAVNFVTGPSRTADVEQTLEIGAHGPKRMLVLLLPGEAPDGAPGHESDASPRAGRS